MKLIPDWAVTLAEKENRIGYNRQRRASAVRVFSLPDNLALELVRSKNLPHYGPEKRIHSPIAMSINAGVLMHQIAHEDEALVDHGDERVGAAPAGVTVGDLFEEVRLFVEGFAA